MVVACVQNPTGPGFESQVPPYALYFFSAGNPVLMPARDASYSLIQSRDRWPQAKSDGPDGTSTILPSQMHTLDFKKSARPAQLGHRIAIQTSKNQAQTLSSLYLFYSCFI